MYQAIHYDDHGPMTDPCRYLRRHDLVYRRPALRPYDGVPVGTGDAGGLLYQTAYGLELTVNHADALDYAPDGAMQAWAWEAEERQTAPVSCGHLSIRSTLPIFDWVYLEAFEQRLILSTASIEGRAKTPFAEASWKLYAPREPDVLVLELEIEQTEEAALEIQIDKWPSPSFFHHYEQILDIHDKNLYCVRAEANRDALLVTQALRRCRTALAVSCGGEPEQLNSHAVCCRFPKQKRHRLTLYLAARASAEASVRENTLAALTAAKDAPSLWQTHCRYWQDFWSRSFLHLQENDYLENLCYLHLYQMGCGNLGKNPLTFAGLWGWFRDARNWGHFYHWNHQQNYWGLYAVGHGELCENYLDYRFRMLPHAIADAKRLFGVEGAFYSDISNLNGFQAIEPDTVRNLSVGAQIALDFYRRVRYQPDEVFLRERALPVMTACAEFYQNLLELRGGVLQLRGGSTAFESYWNLEQNLVDQVLLRALFHALLTLNDAYALDLDAAGYQAVLDRLPPLQTESDFWLVPLLAQYNGYASATFETAAQCAARADVLDAALAAQRGVGPVFRLMGRTVKMPCANERRVPGEKTAPVLSGSHPRRGAGVHSGHSFQCCRYRVFYTAVQTVRQCAAL
jgi:alpha-L-fucosidase 2